MAFKTFVASTALPAADINTYLMKQAVIVCTSGTRPASPVQGETIYQTDTDSYKYWNGTFWDVLPGSLVTQTTGANTITSTGTTEVVAAPATAGLGIATVQLSSTRPYVVEWTGRVTASAITTSAAVVATIRVATGTPTNASTQIGLSSVCTANSGIGGAFDMVMRSKSWTPASTGTWNVVVGIVQNTGGGNGSATVAGSINPQLSIYGA